MHWKTLPISKSISWLAMSGCALQMGACVSVSNTYEQGIVDQTLLSPVQANMPTMQSLALDLQEAPVLRRQDWWTGFEDPILNEIIEYSMRKASNIRQALLRIDQAEVAVFGSSRNYRPSIDAQGSFNASAPDISGVQGNRLPRVGVDGNPVLDDDGNLIFDPPAFFTEIEFGPEFGRSMLAQLNWQPDLYGALKAVRTAGEMDLASAHFALQNAQRLIIGQLAAQYMNLRAQQTTMALLNLRLNAQKEHLQVIEYLYEEGLATKFDTQAIKSSIVQTELQISNIQSEAVGIINTMFVLVGADDLHNFSARMWQDSELPTLPAIPAQLDPVELINARPDLRAAEQALRAQAERVFATKTGLLPNLSTTGSLSLDPLQLFKGDLFDAFGLSVAANLTQRLLNRTELKASTLAQDVQLKTAALTYEQTVRQIVSEIDQSLAARYSAEQRLRAIEGQRDVALVSFQDTLTLFDEGLTERDRVFNAQVAHIDSVSQQYNAFFVTIQSHIQFMTNTVH